MKSIKPGRRRSRYNAVGAVIGIVFGIIWTIAALSMGAPFFFPLFGLVFIGMGVYTPCIITETQQAKTDTANLTLPMKMKNRTR